MLLSSTHLLGLSGPCFDRAYPFNRSVVSSAQVLFILSSLVSLFNRSAVRIWSSLIPFLNRRVFNIYLPFNLKVSQCSLSLVSNGEFSTSFISIVFFSRNGLTLFKVRGFTRLSKKQLSFTSSLSLLFSLRCHSRSRDEILS